MGGESRRGLIAIIADSADLVNFCVLLLNMILFFLPSLENQGWTVVAFEPPLYRAIIFFHYITQFDDGFVSAEWTQPLVISNITLACKSPNLA